MDPVSGESRPVPKAHSLEGGLDGFAGGPPVCLLVGVTTATCFLGCFFLGGFAWLELFVVLYFFGLLEGTFELVYCGFWASVYGRPFRKVILC